MKEYFFHLCFQCIKSHWHSFVKQCTGNWVRKHNGIFKENMRHILSTFSLLNNLGLMHERAVFQNKIRISFLHYMICFIDF